MPDSTLSKEQLLSFIGFAAISLLCIWGAVGLEVYPLIGLPFIVLFGYIALVDFKKIFYLLLFTLPLSLDLDFRNGLSVDFPSELLMVSLMGIFILFAVGKKNALDFRVFKQPLVWLLLTQLFWIGVMILFAENRLVSFKYFLAKNWYVLTFVFLGAAILQTKEAVKNFFWLIYIPLTLVVAQTVVRYAGYGFDFEFVNEPMYPFFRNHVNYAAMTTIFYPFIWMAASWYRKGSFMRIMLNLSKIFYLVAIYLSYTRACYLALAIAAICYLLVRANMLRLVMISAIVLAGFILSTLAYDNNYLKLAPEYNKTIHHKDFTDHIRATYELKDVSSMERVYRWVAAFYMVGDRPVTGFGPGNFYPYYKRYTVNDFETYTSGNEEKSTVHNYFLLVMVEQGVPGLIIFLVFTFIVFSTVQAAYKRAREPETRAIIMASGMALVIIYVNLLLSDLIEVDKTGSLYFLSIALLINFSIKSKLEQQEATKYLAD